MLKFSNPDIFTELKNVISFAKKVEASDSLLGKLRYLRSYGGDSSLVRCVLYPDFAPYSFGFSILRKSSTGNFDHHVVSGGLIYSGPGVPSNGSFPSLTVSLDTGCAAGLEHCWSIHT